MCVIEVTDIWVCPCADKECPCIRSAETRVALRFNMEEHFGHIIKADKYKMVCSWEPCDEFRALYMPETSCEESLSDNKVLDQHTIQQCVEHCPSLQARVQDGSIMQTMDQLCSRCQDSQSPCSGETTLQWMMLCPDVEDCAYWAELTVMDVQFYVDILGDDDDDDDDDI